MPSGPLPNPFVGKELSIVLGTVGASVLHSPAYLCQGRYRRQATHGWSLPIGPASRLPSCMKCPHHGLGREDRIHHAAITSNCHLATGLDAWKIGSHYVRA